MDKIAVWMPLIEQVALIILPLVASLAAWAIRKWVLAKASESQRAMLVAAAEAAYWIVEQVARKTPGKIDDKVAEAIKAVENELKRPLDASEHATVVNTLKAYHEQQVIGVGAAIKK